MREVILTSIYMIRVAFAVVNTMLTIGNSLPFLTTHFFDLFSSKDAVFRKNLYINFEEKFIDTLPTLKISLANYSWMISYLM